MKNIILGIVLALSIVSCTDEGELRENYHPNGNVSERYFVNKEGNAHGLATLYYPNGNVHKRKMFDNGILSGQFKTYHENGKLEYRCPMENDMVMGDAYFYSETGKLVEISTYYDTILKKSKFYYPNGNLKRVRSYKEFEPLYNTDVKFDLDGRILEDESMYVNLKYVSPDTLSISFGGRINNYNDSLILYIKKENINARVWNRDVLLKSNFIRRIKVPLEQRDNYLLHILPTDYINDRLNIKIIAYDPPRKSKNPLIHFAPEGESYYIQLDKGEKPTKYNLDYIEGEKDTSYSKRRSKPMTPEEKKEWEEIAKELEKL